MNKMIRITIFIVILFSSNLFSDTIPIDEWEKFSRTENGKELITWLKDKAFCSLHPICKKEIQYNNKTPKFYGTYGIFVTLVKDKKVRGSYGSFSHASYKINDVLDNYLQGALRHDSKYSPLMHDEIKDARIIVTIASQPIPIFELDSVDLSYFGILAHLEDGTKMVFVPSEIKNHSRLKKKLKGKNVKSFFKFRAIMIR